MEISSDHNVPISERVTAAKQKLREELENVGLGRVADDLERLMAVSIRLKATQANDADFQPGSSKLGGTPDLPEGMAWPECNGVPMALVAQLRLPDVTPYDTDGRLPKSGVLYFFYEARAQAWGFDPKDRGNWAVIYHDGDLTGLRPASPPEDLPEESSFQACKTTFQNDFVLPSWGFGEVEGLDLTEKEGDIFDELLDELQGEGEAIHRMFGYPAQIQGDMQRECQFASNGVYMGDASGLGDQRAAELEKGIADWRLLLQVDSEQDLGMMWGDVGRLYFWIRNEDLKNRDFNKVWLILQCY